MAGVPNGVPLLPHSSLINGKSLVRMNQHNSCDLNERFGFQWFSVLSPLHLCQLMCARLVGFILVLYQLSRTGQREFHHDLSPFGVRVCDPQHRPRAMKKDSFLGVQILELAGHHCSKRCFFLGNFLDVIVFTSFHLCP